MRKNKQTRKKEQTLRVNLLYDADIVATFRVSRRIKPQPEQSNHDIAPVSVCLGGSKRVCVFNNGERLTLRIIALISRRKKKTTIKEEE